MPFRHVLVATDFSECSSAAIEHAVDVTRHYRATLALVHAFELHYPYASAAVGEAVRALLETAEQQMAQLLERVREQVAGATGLVRCGSPWEQILQVAQEQSADLVVVGSHGRKGLPRAVLGSVAEKVVRLSPVCVLTVHVSTARPR